MIADVVRSLLGAKPFEPFTLNLAGGPNFDIVRPEAVTLTYMNDILHLKRPDGSRQAIVAVAHVVSITFPDTPTIAHGVP